jgi:hypothetical protein
MKRELYNLTDEQLSFLVTTLDKEMHEEGMQYIVVGGVAVQAHMLKRLHEKTGMTLVQLAENPEMRLQDYIRSTDDVDLAIDSSIQGSLGEVETAKKIFKVQEGMAVPEVISPSGESILGYTLARKGLQRPIFQVYLDGETDDDSRVTLNIGRNTSGLHNLDKQFYDIFVKYGEEIFIPYNERFELKTRVISPAHLFASKIAKFRAKDTMDIHNLADLMRGSGEEIDLSEIKRLVLPDHEINYVRFLGLTKLYDTNYD